MDNLTILESVGGLNLAKQFSFTEGGFEANTVYYPEYFNVYSQNIRDLGDLSRYLTKLEKISNFAVIRGELKAGLDTKGVRRRYAGASDPFVSCSRHWLCIDIDDLALPEEYKDFNRSHQQIALHAAAKLPEEFRNVDFHWHFSASMGIKSGIRIHLWFWLARPISDNEAKAWLSGSETRIDSSLYDPVHLQFTSNPIFNPKEADPVTTRSGLYEFGEGKTEVTVPENMDTLVDAYRRTTKSPGRLNRNGTQIEPQEIVRDEEGKVIDGREMFLYLKSIEACQELTRGMTLPKDIPAIEAITQMTWELFAKEADLEDGRWNPADAIEKAIYRFRDLEGGWKPNARTETTSLVPGTVPYFELEPLPVKEADEKLNALLAGFFENVERRDSTKLALRVTMGAGKTTKAVEHLKQLIAKNPDLNVEIYLPTHGLIEEVSELLKDVEEAVEVVHMRGRGLADNDGNAPCVRYPFVQSLELAGIPIRPNACYRSEYEQCEHYDGCAYFQQFRSSLGKRGAIRLFPHAYLLVPKIGTLPEPDLVIIDEAFLSSIHYQTEMASEDLRNLFRETDQPELGNLIVSSLVEGEPLLTVLREQGITSEWLNGLNFENARNERVFNGQRADATGLDGNREKTKRFAESIRDVLAEELNLEDRKHVSRLRYDPRLHKVVVDKIQMNPLPENASLLMLDATADQMLLEKIWPDIAFHRVDYEQRAVVTQVYDRTGSNKSWDDGEDRIGDLVTLLSEQILLGDQVLCVSHKKLADELRDQDLPEGVGVEHFGSIRGLDKYKDFKTVFITGRNQPPQAAVDGLARALWWDDDEPLQHDPAGLFGAPPDVNLPTDLRGYLTTDPDEAGGVRVRSFSDPRIEAIHQQQREAETVQAIARLRLVHSPEFKHVYLLGNLPIEMPVNYLVGWSELMPNLAEKELIKKGNIPLTPKGWLTMRPDMVSNDSQAKDMIRHCGLNERSKLLRAIPLMLRLGAMVLSFRESKDGKPFGREHHHLFLAVPKRDEIDSKGFLSKPPFGEWYGFLDRGDDDIPKSSGWGPIHPTAQNYLEAPHELISMVAEEKKSGGE